jgi:hypothetical protein
MIVDDDFLKSGFKRVWIKLGTFRCGVERIKAVARFDESTVTVSWSPRRARFTLNHSCASIKCILV